MTGRLIPLLLICLLAARTSAEPPRPSAATTRATRSTSWSSAAEREEPEITVPGTTSKKAEKPEGSSNDDGSKRRAQDQAGEGAKDGETGTSADGDESTEGEKKTDEKKAPERRDPSQIILDTEYDDRRVGDEETEAVRAEMGSVEDPALNRYVQSVARRLLRYAPPRPFEYEFGIVDQVVPNAFALPGGKIFVSRGLLALVDTEDELAGVLGHEITHAAERHAAARQEISRRINPLVIGWMRMAQVAAYGRDQERDADRGGQILCAKAGYDPVGIATFLRKLDALERYEVGWSRLPFFLATHPTSPERSALAIERAHSLEWKREPGIADDRPLGYLSIVDGLVLGDDPAGGLFEGPLFVHPEMRFSIRFPEGWETMNTQQAVMARSPSGDAIASLSLAGSGDDLEKVVDEYLEKEGDSLNVRVGYRREIQLGKLPAIRLEGRGEEEVMTPVGPQSLTVYMQMTFVHFEGMVFRLALASRTSASLGYRGRATAFAMSFRPLDEEAAHSLRVKRLRIARALDHETLQSLSQRTRNALEIGYTGVINGMFASTELEKGTPVKIGIAEPYLPRPRESKPDADAASRTEKKSKKPPKGSPAPSRSPGPSFPDAR